MTETMTNMERADWLVQRGLANLRTTQFNTYSVEFKEYSSAHATLTGAIEAMSSYATRHGLSRRETIDGPITLVVAERPE